MKNLARKIWIGLFILASSGVSFGQSSYPEAMQMVYAFNAKKTVTFFDNLLTVDTYSYEGHIGKTWYYLQRGKSSDARKYAEYVTLMYPSKAEAWFLLGHTYVLDAELEKAKTYYLRAAKIANDLDRIDFINGIDLYINSGIFIDRFEEIKNWSQSDLPSVNSDLIKQINSLPDIKDLFEKNEIEKAKVKGRSLIQSLTPLDKEIAAEYWAHTANYFFEFGAPDQAYEWTREAYDWALKVDLAPINSHYFSAFTLFMAQSAFGDDPLEAAKYFDAIINPTGPSTIYMQLEGYKLACEVAMRTTLKIDDYVFHFKNLAAKHKQYRYQAEAYNYIGKTRTLGDVENGALLGKAYFQEGVKAAKLSRDAHLAQEILGNYALSLWMNGNKDEAINLYRELIEQFKSEGKYLEATIDINNLGIFLVAQGKYAEAAKALKEGIEIVETKRQVLSADQRQNLLAQEISAYDYLMLAYAHLNDSEELFNIMQKQRARSMRDYISDSDEMVGLSEFQQSLKPDESAIFFNNALEGEMVALVVTNTDSKVSYYKDEKNLADLRKKYDIRQLAENEQTRGFKKLKEEVSQKKTNSYFELNAELKAQKQSNLQFVIELYRQILQQYQPNYAPLYQEFSNALSNFLIKPILPYCGTKSKWLVSASWELNFIPFETLLVQGNPLVVSKDVRYIQSADVAKLVSDRKYSDKRMSMLAMGGAKYSRMTELDQVSGDNESLFFIKRKMDQNIKANQNQRDVFAALGFGQMNYLPGTLEEVNAIEKIVPDMKKIAGTDMNESQIKKMAVNGELKNYKVIHLATHGFSLEMLPELSGVAMSIFETPQNGEDGYLTAYEMMKLDMNADLVVLSACETGLGKLVGGEGVNGLTRALTIGGANRTLVSLWPVSDEGTMLFMTAFYQLVQNEGQSYAQAVNTVKRAFISGQFGAQFNNPNIWAPFVIYGN